MYFAASARGLHIRRGYDWFSAAVRAGASRRVLVPLGNAPWVGPVTGAPVDVLAARWVAELAAHPNGMHEIRAGAVNARERPLVAFAASYELAKAIADAHNCSAAVAELIEAATACVENGGQLVSPGLAAARVDRLRAALARCKGAAL